MKQFLTKEQADWLIEKFKPFLFTSNCLNVFSSKDIFNEAKKIINECTEKEFKEKVDAKTN